MVRRARDEPRRFEPQHWEAWAGLRAPAPGEERFVELMDRALDCLEEREPCARELMRTNLRPVPAAQDSPAARRASCMAITGLSNSATGRRISRTCAFVDGFISALLGGVDA